MSLDYVVKKPVDLKKIDTNDIGELLWWSYIIGTSPENILSIIAAFGNSTEIVRKHCKAE